jgi:hypothetical protein
MNERIHELALQAGEYVNVYIGHVDWHRQFHQKFAELIVRECCDMVNKHLQHNNPNDCIPVLDIKERFGIES